MRLDPAVHRQRDLRIHDLLPDFELLDVWALPIEAHPSRGETFDVFLDTFRTSTGRGGGSRASRFLFGLRRVLGRIFGWDRETNALPIPGCRETSVRERLSQAERSGAAWRAPGDDRSDGSEEGDDAGEGDGPGAESGVDALGFREVFRNERELAMELSNGTVHAVLHLAWAELGPDRVRPEMAVYVKHRGRLGRYYMALISPFRHGVVYPALMRQAEAAWRRRDGMQ